MYVCVCVLPIIQTENREAIGIFTFAYKIIWLTEEQGGLFTCSSHGSHHTNEDERREERDRERERQSKGDERVLNTL